MPAPLAATATRLGEAVAALASATEALRPFGPWAGVLVAIAGAAALVVGARHVRILAVWGGAAVGVLAALALHRIAQAHLGLSPAAAAWAGGAAGAIVCGAFPGVFPLAAGALPGALLGAEVELAGRPAFGAWAGALAAGIAGLAAARVVRAGFASLLGGVGVAVGLSVALASSPLAREIGSRPFALAGVAIVLGIAGTAFQIGVGEHEEERRAPPPVAPGPWPDRPMP